MFVSTARCFKTPLGSILKQTNTETTTWNLSTYTVYRALIETAVNFDGATNFLHYKTFFLVDKDFIEKSIVCKYWRVNVSCVNTNLDWVYEISEGKDRVRGGGYNKE
jgi:hypothetical protein